MKSVLFGLVVLALAGCGGDPYSGLRASCGEEHPAVAHARSLSKEQLSFLYNEILRLHAENHHTDTEFHALDGTIPENLRFLNALRIRPSDTTPNIMLAGCVDEFVYLRVSGPDSKEPGIVLSWAAGTNENPYNTETELLYGIEP